MSEDFFPKRDGKMSLDTRVDSYLGILAIVISNAMSFMDATGPNNGYNLDAVPYDGVTDPEWLGVVIQFVSVTSWFMHLASLLYTVFQLYRGVTLRVTPDARTPTVMFIVAILTSHVQSYLTDLSYWFNLFVSYQSISIPESIGWVMYVATEVPMTVFVLIFVVYSMRLIRLQSPPAEAPRALTLSRERRAIARRKA